MSAVLERIRESQPILDKIQRGQLEYHCLRLLQTGGNYVRVLTNDQTIDFDYRDSKLDATELALYLSSRLAEFYGNLDLKSIKAYRVFGDEDFGSKTIPRQFNVGDLFSIN